WAAGGTWPQRALNAFNKLTRQSDIQAQGEGTELLADIKQIFESQGFPASHVIPSADLLKALHDLKDGKWREYDNLSKPIKAQKVAAMLREFNIRPEHVRRGQEDFRGYLVGGFRDAFERYLSDFETAPTLIF